MDLMNNPVSRFAYNSTLGIGEDALRGIGGIGSVIASLIAQQSANRNLQRSQQGLPQSGITRSIGSIANKATINPEQQGKAVGGAFRTGLTALTPVAVKGLSPYAGRAVASSGFLNGLDDAIRISRIPVKTTMMNPSTGQRIIERSLLDKILTAFGR